MSLTEMEKKVMEFNRITSRDNAQIKAVIALRDSAKTRKEKQMGVVEGLRICCDALENSVQFAALFVSDSALLKLKTQVEEFARQSEVCYQIPDSLFAKISDTNSPQGVLATFHFPKNKPFSGEGGRYIGLENLADPSNLGAIARTAEAIGVDGIILTSNSVDPYAPKVLRASMGTLLRLPLYVSDDLIATAHDLGLTTYACVVDRDATPITEVSFPEGSLLMIGNEANGLTEETKQQADYRITIPMRGKAESLNAAAAGAIAMWEMLRGNAK